MTKDGNIRIGTPYINLQSDFGFKRAFGSEKFKNVVIRFLNAALGEEITVTDVIFHNKEMLPPDADGKRILYDVYCTTRVPKDKSRFYSTHRTVSDQNIPARHHFILEMQNIYAAPFEDRMCYYATKMIADQGKKGWDYNLEPVILIAFMDFDFQHLSKRLVHDVQLRERTTGETLTEKLKMLFFSLKQVPEKWKECSNEIERQLFIIKNMDKMDRNSEAYKSGDYDALFEAAESASIVGEDAVLYSNSLAHLREVQAGLDYRYDEGVRRGRVEGRAEGRAEGMAEGMVKGSIDTSENIARKMLENHYDLAVISALTGLSIERLQELL